MAIDTQRFLAALPSDMRAAYERWTTVEPLERKRRMREYLERQAAAANLDVEELVFLAVMGKRTTEQSAGASADAAPSPRTEKPQSQGRLGDDAFVTLAAGLGVPLHRADGAIASVEEVESSLAKRGVKRSEITMERLAFAVGLLAKGLAAHSEEELRDPNGLPHAIESVYPNTKSEPVAQVRGFLAGATDATGLESYVDEYFNPHRELSLRLPQLCRGLQRLAEDLSPQRLQEGAPRAMMGGLDFRAVWQLYRKRYENYSNEGFGVSLDQTRAWLLKQWLLAG